MCGDSSVGRASDWRSEGRVFDPRSPHKILAFSYFAGLIWPMLEQCMGSVEPSGDSSVWRASDWRSEGHVFDPSSPQKFVRFSYFAVLIWAWFYSDAWTQLNLVDLGPSRELPGKLWWAWILWICDFNVETDGELFQPTWAKIWTLWINSRPK